MNAEASSWLVSTFQFGLAGLVLLLPLRWLWPATQFRSSRRAVVMGASLFWPAFVLVMFEHLAAWYLVDLPGRVPSLRNAPLGLVLLFSFFEYQVYWAVALWLGWLLVKVSALRHSGGPAVFD